MKAIIAVLLFALIGGVFCKPRILDVEHKDRKLSSSSEEEPSTGNLQPQLAQLIIDTNHHSDCLSNNPQNVEYIRALDIFKSKVANRLDTSPILASQPDMKGRLLRIALQKFKSCETPNHSCLGLATGQVMSLIGAYEKNHIALSLDSEN